MVDNEQMKHLMDEYCAVSSMLDLKSGRTSGGPSGVSIGTFAEYAAGDLPKERLSSVPFEEMVELMMIYGPEAHDNRWTPRRPTPKSIARKFSRWFPHFFHRFRYDPSEKKYKPVLGHKQEFLRRRMMRQLNRNKKKSHNKIH